ncbi:hypothetical protein EP331_00920 [bacterium]|nr:MAG: hypothetical protein EP331_00920 [bacterium]
MKLGLRIGFWIVCSILPTASYAQSLFLDSYQNWRASTYLETKSSVVPTTIPGAEHVVATHHNKHYLIHKSTFGEPFAVEWLFQSPQVKDQSDRSLEKQLAGMVLWALDNQMEPLLWSYLTSSSFTVRNAFLKFDKEDNKRLLSLWESKKITYAYESADKHSSLFFIQNSDTLCHIDIRPKLADVLGGNTEFYTEFLFRSLEEPIVPRPQLSYSLNEDSSFPTGMLIKADSTQPLLKKWLEAGFTEEDFANNADFSIKLVKRDTLHYSDVSEKSNTLNHLIQFLSAFGEQKAIGVLTAKDALSIRFLFLFKHTELGYEHVLRIDQTLNNKQQIEKLSVLCMLLNPLTDHLTSFEKP